MDSLSKIKNDNQVSSFLPGSEKVSPEFTSFFPKQAEPIKLINHSLDFNIDLFVNYL